MTTFLRVVSIVAGLLLIAASVRGAEPLNVEASKITLSLNEEPLSDIAKRFAERSGNTPITVPPDLTGRLAALNVNDLPYWQALDRLCAAAKVIYEMDARMEKPTLIFRDAGKSADVGASVGPVAVKVAGMDNVRAFRAGLGPGGLTCTLLCFYEDRLSVIGVDARVTKATTPEGKTLTPEAPAAPAFPPPASGPCRRFEARFLDVPELLDKLATVEGTVRLDVAAGKKEVAFADVAASRGKSVAAGDLTITLADASTETGRGFPVLKLRLQATRDGKPATLREFPWQMDYGFYWAGADGKRQRVPATAVEPSAAARAPEAGTCFITIVGEKNAGPVSLIYVYPEKIASQEFAFKIENVPLP